MNGPIFDHEDLKKRAFWEKAPFDPIAHAKQTGQPHYSRATRGVLFHQSAMPLGVHQGKIMERVPADYLLWLREQKWSNSDKWKPVMDYVDINLEQIRERALRN